MRILFCNYEYPPLGGGGGVINALLAEELSARHEVAVLTSQGLGLPMQQVQNGVQILRVPVLFRRQMATANLASMFAYMTLGRLHGPRLLERTGIDLINTHFVLPSGPVGAALARQAGLPHVLSLHGGDLYDPSKFTSPHRHALLRVWVRRLLRRADRLVGQSLNTIANVHHFYDPNLAIRCIPLGIRRPPVGAPAARAEYGLADDDLVLVTLGRLVARKAVDQLIAMLPGWPARARLLLLGTGPKEPELRRQAVALGMQDRVRFLGFVPEADKFGLLRMADLFVSTSQHEGFGLVFLEAMACGLPVVCYDQGGQTDILETGVTGAIVPLNERSAFAQAVCRLLGDPAARRRMGESCRSHIEAFYIDNCARQYEALFEEVIADRRTTPPRSNRAARSATIPS